MLLSWMRRNTASWVLQSSAATWNDERARHDHEQRGSGKIFILLQSSVETVGQNQSSVRSRSDPASKLIKASFFTALVLLLSTVPDPSNQTWREQGATRELKVIPSQARLA